MDFSQDTTNFVCNERQPDGWTTILKEGFEVEFWGLPQSHSFLNGKCGKVLSISFPHIMVRTVITLNDEETPANVLLQSHHMKFKSGDGYDKIRIIFQMPTNPDYIGQRFVAGHTEGGSSNGCPAFLIAFDPANWIQNDIKRWIRSNMEIQSIADTHGANDLIQMYETLMQTKAMQTEASSQSRV